MSTTIDERVVEMRFDNRDFEQNTARTMSTLERLKQKLNLTGASKGLESINTAAKNVNMNGLGSAVDTVTAKFSAMQIMGTTALVRITNQAMAAGEKMVKALTIDPVKTGFQEYETQINAVQTILANTSSKGSTIDDVNKALEELNKYADKTIYNFTEMTRNIGTFTAAGVDLETSTNAIQGIANLAAVSGSTSQQASTAMYQLSQALASGTVKLMDWNSVVNAGMGGEVFQNSLKETARVHGIAIDQMIKDEGSFRETLSKGWLTSEILTETLQKFTLTTEGLTKEQIEANRQMLKAKGYTEDQIEEIFKLGRTATDAATKVKTFTQLWDVLKESAQSGWSQTWKILIGDFEQAKALLTPLADFLTGAIGKMSDFRNAILEKALNNPFTNTLKSISNVTEGIGAAVKSITDYNKIVDEIIGGKWGNGQARWDKLAEAGYDWAHAQNLVNEKLGSSVRRATDYKEAQEGVTEAQERSIENLVKLSDAELRNLGLTEEQISALNFLEKQAEKTGIPVEELAKDMDLLSGRSLLMNSFKNIGKALVDVFTEVRWAWRDIFHGEGATDEDIINKRALQLYDLIAALHKLTTYLEVDSDRADKLRRTFKGLFAIVDVITTLVGGGFKIAFNLLKSVLGYFNLDILDLTANIGDVLVKFRDWVDSVLNFDGVVSKVIPLIIEGAKAVKRWGEAFLELPFVQKIVGKISEAFNSLKNLDLASLGSSFIGTISKWAGAVKDLVDAFLEIPQVQKIIDNLKERFQSLKDINFREIGINIIEGLKNGLGSGFTIVVEKVKELGFKILDAICAVLGIHSPSVEGYNIGVWFVQGIINGIVYMIKFVIGAVKGVANAILDFFKALDFSGLVSIVKPAIDKIKDLLKKINFDKILALIPVAAALYLGKKILDFVGGVAKAFHGFGVFMESFAGIGEQVNATLKAVKWKVLASAVKEMAIALAIIVGSVIALTILVNDPKELLWAVGTVVVLMAAMAGLAWVISKMSDSSATIEKGKIQIDGVKSSLISIAGAIVLLAATAKILGGMSTGEYIRGMLGVVGLMGLMVLFVWACGKVGDKQTGYVVAKLGNTLIKMAGAMLLLIVVCKLVAKLNRDEIISGIIFIAAFTLFVTILAFVTENVGEHTDKLGGMLIKISIAMILMIAVCKLAAKLSVDDMKAGALFAGGFLAFLALLMLINKIGKNDEIAKIGLLLLSISGAMLLMVLVCKLVSKLSPGEIIAGIATMAVFLIFVGILTKITALDKGKESAKLAGTLIAIAGAIAILAAVAVLLGMVPLPMLVKGVAAVTVLGLIMTAMIWACRGANNVLGNLIVMTVAIGVMAFAVWKLSSIDWKGLAAATISLSVLMAMFMNLIEVGKTASGAIGPLIVMTVAVGVLGAVLYMLGQLPVKSVLGSAIGLSVLLLALAGALKIIDSVHSISVSAMVAMGVMTIIMAGLGGILLMLKNLPIESTLTNAAALSLLIVALSAACVLLGAAGTFGPAIDVGLLALGKLVTGVLALMVIFATLNKYIPGLETFLDSGISVLNKIAYGLGSFIGNIIKGFGDAVLSLLPTLGEMLSSFMDKMQPFISIAGNIGSEVVLGVGYLAAAILELTAAGVLAGFASLFGLNFIALGVELTGFALAASGFFDAIKDLDPAAAEGAKNLAAAILAITVADLIEGIKNFIGGGEGSLTKFAEQIVPFGEAMVAFSQTVSGKIDEGAVTAAANAGKTIAELQKELYGSGGLKQDIFGEKDLSQFATQLTSFGAAIVAFSAIVAGRIDEEAVTAAANAGKTIAELQKELYGAGGLKQDIFGEKDLSLFSTQLVAFGGAIVAFSAAVKGNVDGEAVEDAANAGKAIAALQNELYGAGGLKQDIFGEKDLSNFGTQLKSFGSAMVEFSKEVSGNISEEAVSAAARAGTMMTDLQKNIPEEGWFDGKVNLEEFGEKIVNYGKKLVDYSDEVSEMDTATVADSLAATLTLVNIAKALQQIDAASTLLTLAPITDIGTKLKEFGNKMAEVDIAKLGSSVDIAVRLKGLITNLSNIDTRGVDRFKTAIEKLSQTNFSDLTSAFEGNAEKLANIGADIVKFLCSGMENQQGKFNATANKLVTGLSTAITSKESVFSNAGNNLIEKFIKALSSGKKKTTSVMKEIITGCLATVRNKQLAFHAAGSNLADGFANGISANTYKAVAQAKAMADAAEQAAKEALGIKSPSRVFYKIGDYTGQGFINALAGYASKAYRSATDMGDSAKSGLNDALSKAYDIINGDLETQPTIRPVLDLSSVEAGASRMNGLLNGVSNVGVMTNMNAIGSMMEQRRQNGSNADVVSAIDKLRKGLGNMGGTTYQINGVSYDDGSNIADAVETIARAALRERRT